MEFGALSEEEHLYRSGGCARSKPQYLAALRILEIVSLDAGLPMDGLPALDLWDLVIEVLRTTQGLPKPRTCSGKPHPKKHIHDKSRVESKC